MMTETVRKNDDLADLASELEYSGMRTVNFVFVSDEVTCVGRTVGSGVRLLESFLFDEELRRDEFPQQDVAVSDEQIQREHEGFRRLPELAQVRNVSYGYLVHKYGQTKACLSFSGMEEFDAVDQIREELIHRLEAWTDYTRQ